MKISSGYIIVDKNGILFNYLSDSEAEKTDETLTISTAA